ncbi:MAG: hypothetical protein C0412_15875 [Flavobacterium sp.]|nr:hypothetical protein [Flavobacterium sp.]
MDQKLKELLKRLLSDTQPLAEAAVTHDTKFLNVLLGIYRVSFATLRDIYYLSSYEETGSSALALARKIIEHGITVEYIIMKGKEGMAERFQNYLWVQTHDEIEFLKSIGQNPADLSEELKLGVKETEREYSALKKETKKDKTWAGKSIDGMLEDLYKAKALGDFDFSRLGRAYIWGSRLNHPNPFVVRGYLAQEDQKVADEFYLRQAMFMAIIIHLRLTTRYIDEIRILSHENTHQNLADKVSATYKEIDNLESK